MRTMSGSVKMIRAGNFLRSSDWEQQKHLNMHNDDDTEFGCSRESEFPPLLLR